jgi:hypothetical protein
MIRARKARAPRKMATTHRRAAPPAGPRWSVDGRDLSPSECKRAEQMFEDDVPISTIVAVFRR